MNPLRMGLVAQILIGVALGALVGLVLPTAAEEIGLLGQLFVGMLKAVAPLLVLLLVMSAIANRHEARGVGPCHAVAGQGPMRGTSRLCRCESV